MTIGRKFAIWIVSILTAVSAVTVYVFYTIELRDESAKLDLFGRMAGRIIEESLITFMQRRDNPGLSKKLGDVKKNAEPISGILLLNRDGVVKAATDKELINRKFGMHDAGCRRCHEKGGTSLLLSGGQVYRWASHLENKPACHACHQPSVKNNGVLVIDFSVAEFKQHVREELLEGLAIFGSSIILMGAIMVLLSRALVTRRLDRMGAAMKEFQQGRPSAFAPVEGHDEITRLETGFNQLALAITSRDREKNELLARLNAANDQLQREIAHRMRWERMQREQLQFLQLLIDTIPMPVFYKDRDGIYLGCNKIFLEYTGLTKDKIVGKTVYDVAPKELADKYYEMDKELFDRHGVQVYEYSVKHADGTVRHVIFNKATYTDAEGKVAGLIGVMPDITERKQIEGALRETNELLQAVIHASPLAVMSFDRHGNVGIWNSAAERIFGWSEQEVLGHFNPLVTEANKREFLMLLERVLRGESITGMELRRQRKDGSLIDVSVSSAPLRDANDRISGIMSAIADITERKRAEEAIRRNYDTQTAINWILHISLKEMPLDSVLKQALDLILSIPWLSIESQGSIFLVENDPDKLVMKAQRGLSDYLREECKVVPFGKCLCGRAAARGEVQFAGALDERHEIHYEGMDPHGHYCVPIIHAKRVLGVINLYLKTGHRRDQKEIEFLNALADALAGIIQRKRIENDREKLIGDLRSAFDVISRSHKEWQDTFDSITDMISIVDENFTILKANRAFSAYYGLRPPDVINKKCYELIHDGDSPIPDCSHRTTMAEKKASGGELFDKRTKRTFSIFTFPYNSPDGEILGSIHIMRDITDDKEQEMRLITSERLAALGQMASAIAHEINNPLASIAGRSEGLLSRVRKGQYELPLFESSLNIIQEEVFRCKSITTAMLSLVRKATDEKKSINLPEALDKTMEIIGFQGRMKNIEVVKKYQEPLPMIHGNEDEFRQVLLAVITNALDAMHDKGKLTIEAETGDRGAVIRLGDTGEGISPEIIDRIFDPFFTTKSDRGSAGLGLSIARKIIANHNGRISASSSLGQGTTFTITLPQ